jgi:hypothetical protein
VLATLSVFYFEYRSNLLDTTNIILVPYLSYISASVVIAYFLGGWYIHDSEFEIFEIITIPFIVIGCAAVGAGILFGLATYLNGDTAKYTPLAQALAGGFFSGIVFILVTWPILLFGACTISTWLYRKNRNEVIADIF